MKDKNVGQIVPDNQTKCHSKLDLESHRMLLSNNEILNQVQNDRGRGFTLIELLVVVLIIGILAAVALPQYQLAVAKSRVAAIQPLLVSLKQAEEAYYLEHGKYTDNILGLDINLEQCSDDSKYKSVKVCGNFMIDLLSGNGTNLSEQQLRAAYCPSEIKGAAKWDSCAYTTGDYVYTVWLSHSKYPNIRRCDPIESSTLGTKVCNLLNL